MGSSERNKRRTGLSGQGGKKKRIQNFNFMNYDHMIPIYTKYLVDLLYICKPRQKVTRILCHRILYSKFAMVDTSMQIQKSRTFNLMSSMFMIF